MYELPCGYLVARLDVSSLGFSRNPFDWNDSIGTGRQHRTRHDFHALARVRECHRWRAGGL